MRTGKRLWAYLLAMVMLVTSIFGTGLPIVIHAAETTTVTYELVDLSSDLSKLDTTGATKYVLFNRKNSIALCSSATVTDGTSSGMAVTFTDNVPSAELSDCCYWHIKQVDGGYELYTETDSGYNYLASGSGGTGLQFVTTSDTSDDDGVRTVLQLGRYDRNSGSLGIYTNTEATYFLNADKGFYISAASANNTKNVYDVYKVIETTTSTPDTDTTVTPIDGMIGQYLFDGDLKNQISGGYADEKAAGRQSTDTTAAYREDESGAANKALDLNGYGLQLDVAPTTDTFAVSFDMLVDTEGSNTASFFMINSDNKWLAITPHEKDNAVMGPLLWYNSTEVENSSDLNAITTGTWATISLIVKEGYATMYVDGKAVAEGQIDGDSLFGSTPTLFFGTNAWTGDGTLDGAVDNLYIFDETAAATMTIGSLYAATGKAEVLGKFLFDGSLKNEITGNNAQAWNTTIPGGANSNANVAYNAGVTNNAIVLDKTYGLKLDAAPDSDDFVVSFDMKLNSTTDWTPAVFLYTPSGEHQWMSIMPDSPYWTELGPFLFYDHGYNDVTYDGTVIADGTNGWASGGTGKTFTIDENGVTVVFTNDAFTRAKNNYDNFIIETIASADAAGATLRADAYGWTYGDNTTNIPTIAVETSWGADWSAFQTLTDLTDVTVNAKKTSDTTVEFYITFASDAAAWEKYTLTYPAGVPDGLTFQIGADGGIVTLLSASGGSVLAAEEQSRVVLDLPAGDPLGRINTTEWATVTVVMRDSHMIMYVNGVQVYAADIVDKGIITDATEMYVGINYWGDTPLDGAIDNLYVLGEAAASMSIDGIFDIMGKEIGVAPTDWSNAAEGMSVHDPSVVEAVDSDGTPIYYIFGTHLTQAKSKDLISWKNFGNLNIANTFESQHLFAKYDEATGTWDYNIEVALADIFKWAGSEVSDVASGRNVPAGSAKVEFGWDTENGTNDYGFWAPDVIWNADYVWEDGSKGAWMNYFSTTSAYTVSAIGFAVSKDIEGPYQYVDTVVYSGFSNDSTSNVYIGSTDADGNYLIDDYADGILTAKDKYFFNSANTEDQYDTSGGTVNGWYDRRQFPNAIDPNLTYDEYGNLYLTYGSYAGGIWILQLDKATGQPNRNDKDWTYGDGRVIDTYFGTKIAAGNLFGTDESYTDDNGNSVQNVTNTTTFNRTDGSTADLGVEGPYIVYDATTDYYYLYVSYFGLNRADGYQMRVFRSKCIDGWADGAYVDTKGMAIFSGEDVSLGSSAMINKGYKLFGNYSWADANMTDAGIATTGYMSAGHNSVLQASNGQTYLVSHTRRVGTDEYHRVKVQEIFYNSYGWPVVAPFEYDGTTISGQSYSEATLCGVYQFINHLTDQELDTHKEPGKLTLKKDHVAVIEDEYGNVVDANGYWIISGDSFSLTYTHDGSTKIYYGKVIEQTDESTENTSMYAITLAGGTENTAEGNNSAVWAVRATTLADFKLLHPNENGTTTEVQGTTQAISYTGATREYELDLEQTFEDSLPTTSIIKWTSSDESVATVDGTGKVTFVGEGNVEITCEVITDQTLDTEASQYASVTFVITKEDKVHYPTDEDADDYFPAAGQEGSVTINKEATRDEDYRENGTAKIELDITGVPESQPVDIILVMDVSRSMIGLPEGSTGAYDEDIINYDKLNHLRDSAADFVEQILGGSNTQNRIALVQFADDAKDANGEYYEVNSRVISYFEGSSMKDNLISLIYNGVDTSNTYVDATGAGGNTDLTQTTNGAGNGYLYLNTTGEEAEAAMVGAGMTLSTQGGTNYGLAFRMAEKVMNADTLDDDGRKKIVLFMTDGGPSALNLGEDSVFSTGLTNEKNGTTEVSYDETNKMNGYYLGTSTRPNVAATAWAQFVLNRDLAAVSRMEAEGYSIISLGYDLESDSAGYFYRDYYEDTNGDGTEERIIDYDNAVVNGVVMPSLTVRQMILENIASSSSNYYLANSENLEEVYAKIADSILSSATNTKINDVIGDDFELRVLPFESDGKTINSKIEIIQTSTITTAATSHTHDFTTAGATSNYFTIAGNVQNGAGATYNGITYSGQSLKFEGDYDKTTDGSQPTSVSFTPEYDGTFTLVFGTDNSAAAGDTIYVSGTSYALDENLAVTVSVKAGETVTVTRDGKQLFLYYMEYVPSVTSTTTTVTDVVETVEFVPLGTTVADGVEVYSTLADGTKKLLTTVNEANKESYVLYGTYFTFDAATKTFHYQVGSLAANTVYTIRYDAYLKGSVADYEIAMGYIDSAEDRTPATIYESHLADFTVSDTTSYVDTADTNAYVQITEEDGNKILQVHGGFGRTAYAILEPDLSSVKDGFTISMKVKNDANAENLDGYTNGGYEALFTLNWENGTEANNDNGFFLVNTAGKIAMNTTYNLTGDAVTQPWMYYDYSGAEIVTSADEWKTVTMTIDTEKITVYVDGVVTDEVAITALGHNHSNDINCYTQLFDALQKADNIWLGSASDFWGWWSYNGYYDDIMIYDYALTAEQIENQGRRVPNSNVLHDTNVVATATYDNVNGDTCMQTYEIPQLAWNSGKITYKFYLAKATQDGTVVPIDGNAKIITGGVEDYVIIDSVSSIVDYGTLDNTSADNPGGVTFADEALKSDKLQEGIANGTYSYILTTTSVDGTTIPIGEYVVYYDESTGEYVEYILPYEGGDLGILLEGNDGTAEDTVVYFPITLVNIASNKSDVVVLDYGLPVEIDLLANDQVGGVLNTINIIGLRKVSETLSKLPEQSAEVDNRFVANNLTAMNMNLEFTGDTTYDVSGNAWRDNTGMKTRLDALSSAGLKVENQALVLGGQTKTAGWDGLWLVDTNILSNATQTNYTFATWINPSASVTGDTIMYSNGNARWLEVRMLDVDTDNDGTVDGKGMAVRVGVSEFYTDANGARQLKCTHYYDVDAKAILTMDAWNHVAFTYADGVITIYYNGAAVSTGYIGNIIYEPAYVQYCTDNGIALTYDDIDDAGAAWDWLPYGTSIPAPFNSYNQGFYIGASCWSAAYMNASLDGIKLYAATLTADQIAAIYNNTSADYASAPYGNDGTRFAVGGDLCVYGGNTYVQDTDTYGHIVIAQTNTLSEDPKNAHVIYTMQDIMDGADDFMYALRYEYKDHSAVNYVYGTLKVLPANNVYYEDNFGAIDYTGTEVTDGEITDVKQWQTIVGAEAKTSQDFQLADMQGSDVVYGYDSNYTGNDGYSNDTVTAISSTALAKFTFTGTGFDIVSRTNQESVEIAVLIKPTDTTQKAKMLVHNLYYDDGDLYQIPVISVKDLAYGEYTVQILARYERDLASGELTTNNQIFYLDGIRIYNPLGVDDVDTDHSELRENYYADGENNARFVEIRNELLGANKMQLMGYSSGSLTASGYTTTEHINFGDDGTADSEEGSKKNFQATMSAAGWEDYLKRGPNNEMYLSPGQAVVFQIVSRIGVNETLQVAAKTPNGETTMAIKVGSAEAKSVAVNTKTEMYYEITSEQLSSNTQIVIANTGADANAYLSLSNFKINGYRIATIFTASTPDSIPDGYALVSGSVYSYGEEYRTYGTYTNGLGETVTGWFICDEEGNLQGYEAANDTVQQASTFARVSSARLAVANSVLDVYETDIILKDETLEAVDASVGGYSLSLKGNIAVNFYMDLGENVLADEGAYVQFTLPNGTVTKVPVAEATTKVISGATYYQFICEVAAKEMTDDIAVKVVLTDGRESDTFTYTVKDYADYIIANEAYYSENIVALVKSMLNYGGYAQTQFGYNEEEMANEGLNLSLDDVTIGDEYKSTASGAVAGITYYGASLVLKSETAIKYYFTLADGADIADYSFTCNGEALEVTKTGNYYYVEIADIAAKDLDTMYRVEVTDGSDTLTVSFAALSYAKSVLESEGQSEVLQNTARALYKYWQAAEQYFGTR